LGAFPEALHAQGPEILFTLGNGQEVISGQLTQLAGKTAGAVGQNNFGLGIATGVKQNIAYRRMTRVILKPNT
jgi:hypothetical protein